MEKKRILIPIIVFILLVSIGFAANVIVVKLDENNPISLYNLGTLKYYSGQKEEAVSFMKKALELNPNYDKAYYSLGLIYFKDSSYEEAIKNLEKANEINSENSNYNFDLAISYVELFRKKESENSLALNDLDLLRKAVSHYEKTVALDENFENAKSNLEIVKNVLEGYES